ncbi:TonB-dependent receptor [Marivirga tractuosa]|uniref:TonB-dependent receptor plug n=1 Tax=Marivirga tractuosa (strain ATCC 23168 / DSM 4126 / NBRC 15989 / NCIMB 1408 / VKM B-1430 / H-43) TaxID=643867 RepID=E4TPU9_MARTH|nr:TonB-dependent receptor [Marivirga tractuosa]ADR23636.1 TonB-dependent receptor plug [Marivirga tractuosa DSM 4126]BDD15683.1 TonB-dependent receptor [Marivirga tractuosa]
MKKFITILLIISSFGVEAQNIISGYVTSTKGDSLPGVSVYIKNTYDGTSTNAKGFFSFKTAVNGSQFLVAQSVGYKNQELAVNLNESPLQIEIQLKEAIDQLNAVTITAGAMEASDENKAVVLKPLDIVTTPSAMGDIIGAFQTLPGTSTVGNDGRLFVRGGDASETAIFIDGLQVGNAFGTTASNVPTRTRFSPNLFKGSFFSTGGYSAEYGQALSSALALNTVDIPLRSQGDVSIMSLGGGYIQTLVGKNNSITASANYFDLSPYQSLIKQNFDWERSPYGWDFSVAGTQKVGNGGFLKAYFQKESNGLKLWQKQPGDTGRGNLIGIKNDYTYAQSNIKLIGQNNWSYTAGISYSDNFDQFDLSGQKVNQRSRLIHAKGVAIKDFSDAISLKTGLESTWSIFEESLVNEGLTRDFLDQRYNVFVESDYYLSNQLIFRGGVRSGYSILGDELWVDPRASVSYKFEHEGQLSFAYGRFSQLPMDKFRVLNNSLGNTEAEHFILNYFISKKGRTFRAEAFHKSYDNLITFSGSNLAPENISLSGTGYAKGMDFFYRDRKSIKETDFWVTYSFVDSKRKFDSFETQVQPSFAPKHNASIVAKHFVSALQSQIGMSFSFNDGYVFTNPNLAGEQNSKTKSFQDLSLSWSYLPKPNLIIHLACSNVLGRDNIFGYQYASQPNESGLVPGMPIAQGAPRFLFMGIFLTLSKDKTANQLNNL